MVTIAELDSGAAVASGADAREKLIAEGNSRFVDEDWEGALQCYTRANEALPESPSAQALSRRAAVHMKLHNFEDAIADANKAIEADGKLAISYLRKGIACFELDEHEAALAALEAGARLDPHSSVLKKWIRKAEAELTSEGATGAPRPSPPENVILSREGDAPSPLPPPGPSSSLPPAPTAPRFRHEWYQSSSQVVLTIFAKGIKPEQLHVDFGEQVLSVAIDNVPGEEPYVLSLRLFGKISPSASKFVLLSTKVEVRLAKAEAIQWTGLEAAARAKAAVAQPINVSTDAPGVKSTYPSSSRHRVDWNKLEQEVKKEEKEEKLEGDAGLNKFFQQIYGDSDEETRRAMNKSFVESGGTVLSTNWKEVGSKKVDAKT